MDERSDILKYLRLPVNIFLHVLCSLIYSHILPCKPKESNVMDTNKWKSVLVPREIYLVIKEMSKAEGRTISGQLRVIFDDFVQKYKPRDEDDRFDN